jgi:hypothetical protein
METITTSTWRPQRGVLCALLLSTVALCGIVKGAQVQIYITQLGNGPDAGSVGEYDALIGPEYVSQKAANLELRSRYRFALRLGKKVLRSQNQDHSLEELRRVALP